MFGDVLPAVVRTLKKEYSVNNNSWVWYGRRDIIPGLGISSYEGRGKGFSLLEDHIEQRTYSICVFWKCDEELPSPP